MICCGADVFSRYRRKARFLFGLSDVAFTALGFFLAYLTRSFLQLENVFYLRSTEVVLLLGFAIFAWLLSGIWLEVYDKLDVAGPLDILRLTLKQCAVSAVALILFEFLLRLDLSRVFLILFAIYTTALLGLFRCNAGSAVRLIRREFGAPHYMLIAGLGDRARYLARVVEQSSGFNLRLLGFLADVPQAPATVSLDRDYPVYRFQQLQELLRGQVIDEILFAVDGNKLSELEEIFLLCDEQGVRTRIAVDFFPHVNSELYLDRLGPVPLLTFAAAPHDELRLFCKRVVDVALASTAIVLVLPLMAIIALLIRLTSPGPAIFRQIRCGLNGRRFVFYKFRSMCANAEDMKASLAHLNQKELAFKIPNDPRLTPLGRVLRKFSIDEWPQLWNVVKGDMSLVGPRPAVPEEVEQYKGWQRRRLRMRPGLTCLWALNGRDHLDFETWMKLDMQYIDNWSLALDYKILLRTIPHVLLGKGAH